MNSRTGHARFEQLADLVEDRLVPSERTAVLGHLAGCARCAAEASSLERLVELMRTDDSTDPPPPVVARAVRLIRARADAVGTGLRRRLIAALTFDSRLTPGPVFGLRAGPAAERQMVYSVGDYDLELRVAEAGDAWAVSGQMLGPCDGGHVEFAGLSGRFRTELSGMCEFRLPPAPAGAYALTVRLTELDVEITELILGS
jgi:anti-sigma factor RsiW